MIPLLIVDDETSLLDIAKIYLEKTGDFTVDTAESAREALEIMQTATYDAIVSDYQMPEMNGIEFLKTVRGSGSDIPFIIFTGRGREDVVIEALNEGADFYLQKGGQLKSQFAELSHKIRQAVLYQQAKDLQQIIFENTGTARVILEDDTTISYVNEEMEHPTGYSKEEIEGRVKWPELVSVTSLYDLYKSDIQTFFSSAISIKVLLLLSGKVLSMAGLCAEIGHVHAAVLPKIRQLEEHGLITRTDGSYALTTLGTVLAAKIVALFSIPAEISDDALSSLPDDGEGVVRELPLTGHTSAVLDLYAAHVREINLVVRSGIRTRMLLALLNGRMDRDFLRGLTGCSSSNFRTNMRNLVNGGLVREHVDSFVLTPRGRAFASQVREFVPLYCLILKHLEFWGGHALRNLPGFALDTIGALVESEIICDDSVDYFQTYEHYLSIIAGAKHIHAITSMANPSIADAIGAMVIKGTPAEIIVPPDLALHLYQEPYLEKVTYLSTFPHFQFYVTDLPLPPCITVTDAYLSMKLFFTDMTTYDLQNGFVSTSPEACAWGDRLFTYYRRNSVPIEEFIEAHATKSGEHGSPPQ